MAVLSQLVCTIQKKSQCRIFLGNQQSLHNVSSFYLPGEMLISKVQSGGVGNSLLSLVTPSSSFSIPAPLFDEVNKALVASRPGTE